MKITEVLNIKKDQSELSFANVDTRWDHELYLDANIIETNKDYLTGHERDLSKRAALIISDFFNTVFDLYNEDNVFKAEELLDESSEKNGTHLGKTKKGHHSQGKGCSITLLSHLFRQVYEKDLLQTHQVMDPMDTTLFIYGFGEDRMSDLLTSILLRELVNYTEHTAKSYGYSKFVHQNNFGKYWDINSHSWKSFDADLVLDENGLPLIFVPKCFLTGRYVYDTTDLIMQFLMEYKKNQIIDDARKEGKIILRVNKKNLYKEESNRVGLVGKEFAIYGTRANPEVMTKFRTKRKHSLLGTDTGRITNTQLEQIIRDANPHNK